VGFENLNVNVTLIGLDRLELLTVADFRKMRLHKFRPD
jgi:hypothetical protein